MGKWSTWCFFLSPSCSIARNVFFSIPGSRQSSPATLNMEEALDFLGEKIVDPAYTEKIAPAFHDTLLLIISRSFPFEFGDRESHQKKCVSLSKLIKYSPEAKRFVELKIISSRFVL